MMEACLEKKEAMDLEANAEEVYSPSQSIRKSLTKKSQWRLLEHWRTNMGTSIWL
jgi:hypothetical protein